MAAQANPPCSMTLLADSRSTDATDRILQEFTAEGRRLETINLKISDLSAATTFILAHKAHFQLMVMDLDQRLMTVEDRIATMPVQATEIQHLRAKMLMSTPFLKTFFLNSQA
ncbi:hypothetical protein NDU88_000183 [Pleurodeles waltl]|uniref:Uncharacterized protein n=1 Tax=Pleurodeles waltl TaxID=8319 RepID=A0AAV7V4S0_PLEWA|nr:hypothetical protein NDU88_000183 [Pleurodeles waltl]